MISIPKETKPLSRFTKNFLSGITLLYFITVLLVLILTDTITETLFTSHLKSQVQSLMTELPDNAGQSQLIRYLSLQRYRLFFRVTLLNHNRVVIYESQSGSPTEIDDPYYLIDQKSILDAVESGSSYNEHYSSVTLQEMAYIAIRFNYLGQNYILRSSFPLESITKLKGELRSTFLAISSTAFFLFGALIWLLIHRLNQPLTRILRVIAQKSAHIAEGDLQEVPSFEIQDPHPDFTQLITTFNHLSRSVNSAFASLMHERNEKDAILNSMLEGVLSIDKSLKIRYLNPATSRILNVREDDLVDKHLLSAHLPEIYDLLTEDAQQLEATPLASHEMTIVRDGRRRYLSILVNKEPLRGLSTLVIRDETPRHELNEMRKAFVANASHELRTPITIIRGFAETLQDHPQISEVMLSEIMGKIVNNCERMVNLITSLMTLARVENMPSSQLSCINMKTLCSDVVTELKSVHPKAMIELCTPPEHASYQARGDHELLRIVIKNLIENGIKYSESPEHITLSLSADDAAVYLKFQDRGIGIPKEDLPYIFERFYRVDKARSKKTGGFGLGLSLVKTIIDKHEAEISVESQFNEGTTFKVKINK